MRNKNVAERVRRWIDERGEAKFSTTDCRKGLNLQSNALRMPLSRLCDKGLIERLKPGHFRKMDATGFPVVLPLRIHDHIKVMPKDIIIVLGDNETELIAFLLNIAGLNAGNHGITYFPKEPSCASDEFIHDAISLELERVYPGYNFISELVAFELPDVDNDKIRPNGITIKLADDSTHLDELVQIFEDRLATGIGIIAIPHASGEHLEQIASSTMEKTHHCITLQRGVCEILKTTNRASTGIDPTGMRTDVIIQNSVRFFFDGFWTVPNKKQDESVVEPAEIDDSMNNMPCWL